MCGGGRRDAVCFCGYVKGLKLNNIKVSSLVERIVKGRREGGA